MHTGISTEKISKREWGGVPAPLKALQEDDGLAQMSHILPLCLDSTMTSTYPLMGEVSKKAFVVTGKKSLKFALYQSFHPPFQKERSV